MHGFAWTDQDLDRTAHRAVDLYSHLFDGPAALRQAVDLLLPGFAACAPDARRAAWSLDLARTVLALEHDLADWDALAAQAQAVCESRTTVPLRDAVQAVRAGDLDSLAASLDDRPDLLYARGTHGYTLLGHAALAVTGDRSIPLRDGGTALIRIVELLLARDADPDAAAGSGWTPLHTAAMSGATDLVDILLEAGADPAREVWGEAGGTPLSLALFYAHTGTARRLAAAAMTPDNLRTRAGLGDVAGVRACLRADDFADRAGSGRGFYRPLLLFPPWAPSDARQEILDEALTWAARNGQVEVMAELHASGADLDANPYRGTALLWSVYGNHADAATWLLDHGADPNLRHDFGGAQHGRQATALHLAAQFGQLRSIGLLLARGADPTVRDANWDATPAAWARHAGQTEAAALLAGGH